jgi:hypothetical protein
MNYQLPPEYLASIGKGGSTTAKRLRDKLHAQIEVRWAHLDQSVRDDLLRDAIHQHYAAIGRRAKGHPKPGLRKPRSE